MKVSPTRAVAAAAAVLAVGTDALSPGHQPARTVPVDAALHGFSPKPTRAPSARRAAQLLARDDDDDPVTILYNNDNTCGYLSGHTNEDAAFTCGDADAYCALYTAHDNIPGRMACCNDYECGFRVTCLDRDDVLSSSYCDDACLADPMTRLCTDKSAPYCVTLTFPESVTDFVCGAERLNAAQLVLTTSLGQTVGGTYFPYVVTDLTSSSPPVPTASPTRNRGSDDDDDSDLDSGSASDSDSSSDSDSDSDSDNKDDEDNDKKKKKSTPVGAIVGGVVGGVGAIGIAALAFVFLRRHKKKKQQKSSPQQSPGQFPPSQPMQQGSPPPNQPYYDPKFGAAAAYNNPNYDNNNNPNYNYNLDPNNNPHASWNGSYQPSSPSQNQSMYSPPGGVVSPTTSYANTAPSPPPQQFMQQQQQQQHPATSPPQINNAYNAPAPRQASSPPGAAPGAVHEAPTDISDQHRGEMHELA